MSLLPAAPLSQGQQSSEDKLLWLCTPCLLRDCRLRSDSELEEGQRRAQKGSFSGECSAERVWSLEGGGGCGKAPNQK